MPKASSKKQQMAAGAALSAKRGEECPSELQGASKGMYESMSEDDLEEMAGTERESLPTRSSRNGGSSGRARSSGRSSGGSRKSSARKSSSRSSGGTRAGGRRKSSTRKSSRRSSGSTRG